MNQILPVVPRANRIVVLGGDVTDDLARRDAKDKHKWDLILKNVHPALKGEKPL